MLITKPELIANMPLYPLCALNTWAAFEADFGQG